MKIDFSTYWNLQTTENQSPLFCKAPAMAYKRLIGKQQTSLGLQRKQTQKFRRELVLTHLHPRAEQLLAEGSFNALAANLANQGSEAETAMELSKNFGILDHSQQCNLIYVLLSLGFYDEAVGHLQKTQLNSLRLEGLHWLAKDLQSYGVSGPIGLQGMALLKRIPRTSKNSRLRFNLFLQLVVYFSQRVDMNEVLKLKDLAPDILKDVEISGESDFTLAIMKSKYFRSVSYIPFLEKDYQELKRQTDLIEHYALAAVPTNADEEIIWKENLFPMKESTARIYDFLGNKEEALKRLRAITESIDPFDSKAWLQLGDYELKLGLTTQAQQSYEKSIECIMPHGQIAHFKTGLLLESQGEDQKALEHFIKSSRYEPNGLSPLLKIYQITKKIGSSKLFHQSETSLTRLLGSPQATRSQKEMIQKVCFGTKGTNEKAV
jgi:tetratricopeptide (TPR) repeat protein